MSTTIAKMFAENIFLNLPAKGFYGTNKVVHEEASSGSRVVEHSSHHPSSKGLCLGVIKYSCVADHKILDEIGMSTTIANTYVENIF